MRKKFDVETSLISFDDVLQICQEILPPAEMFSSVKTRTGLDKILTEKFNMITAKKLELGYDYRWKKRKINKNSVPRLIKVTEDAYIVPFLNTMKVLLQNEEVRYCIENSRPHVDGKYRSILDGNRYRQHEFLE